MLQYSTRNNVVGRIGREYQSGMEYILALTTTVDSLAPVVGIEACVLHKIFRDLDGGQMAEILTPFLKQREAEIRVEGDLIDAALARITGTIMRADYDTMTTLFAALREKNTGDWEFEVSQVNIACKVVLLRDTTLVYEGYTFEPNFKEDISDILKRNVC